MIFENSVSIETGGGLDQRGFLEEIPCSFPFVGDARRSLNSSCWLVGKYVFRIFGIIDFSFMSKNVNIYSDSIYLRKNIFSIVFQWSPSVHFTYIPQNHGKFQHAHTHKIALRSC